MNHDMSWFVLLCRGIQNYCKFFYQKTYSKKNIVLLRKLTKCRSVKSSEIWLSKSNTYLCHKPTEFFHSKPQLGEPSNHGYHISCCLFTPELSNSQLFDWGQLLKVTVTTIWNVNQIWNVAETIVQQTSHLLQIVVF